MQPPNKLSQNQTHNARAKFLAIGKSPNQRAEEKKLLVLKTINEMGLSTWKILLWILETKNKSCINKLIKEGFVSEITPPNSVLTTRFKVEAKVLVLTQSGLDYVTIFSGKSIPYPEVDRSKIHWANMNHDLDLHITLIECVKSKLISKYFTGRQLNNSGAIYYKLFDAIGVDLSGSKIGFELERTEKTGRKLDEVKQRLAQQLAARDSKNNRVIKSVWYFMSAQIQRKYTAELSGNFKYHSWEKRNNKWQTFGSAKELPTQDVGLIEFHQIK